MRNVEVERERISRAVSSLAALKAARREQVLEERLFIGVYPCGIVYADRGREEHGDYKRLGFLSYSTLKLDIETDCSPDFTRLIKQHAATFQARKGDQFEISASGQTVALGGSNA